MPNPPERTAEQTKILAHIDATWGQIEAVEASLTGPRDAIQAMLDALAAAKDQLVEAKHAAGIFP